MDWLRQVPMGQYVDGSTGWLRRLDPRLKLAWSLVFLLTPVLAGPLWRVGLVVALVLITLGSGLARSLWWRSVLLLTALAVVVGLLSMFLPAVDPPAAFPLRNPAELPGLKTEGPSWDLLRLGPLQLGGLQLGPLVVDRASALLGLRTSTLIFTVIHSVNLMLITTPPEDLVWALSWCLAPLKWLGLSCGAAGVSTAAGTSLSASGAGGAPESAALSRQPCRQPAPAGLQGRFRPGAGSVGERLLANILLRAEQGADALVARGGRILGPSYFRMPPDRAAPLLNGLAMVVLVLVIGLRGQYGAL